MFSFLAAKAGRAKTVQVAGALLPLLDERNSACIQAVLLPPALGLADWPLVPAEADTAPVLFL